MRIRKKCCYNCEHWLGNRESTLKSAEASKGESFSLTEGWNPTGGCTESSDWAETVIWGTKGVVDTGLAFVSVDVRTDAAFCCNLFKWRDDAKPKTLGTSVNVWYP